MNRLIFTMLGLLGLLAWGCNSQPSTPPAEPAEFAFLTEQFADLKILRYQIPGFEELAPKEKELIYYLYQASLSGRDIIWDQNYRHNLLIRHTLEAIVRNQEEQGEEWNDFMTYLKRLWVANGIHHHYSNQKFEPGFSEAYFRSLVASVPEESLPLAEGQTVADLLDQLVPVMFDPNIDPKKVNKAAGVDVVAQSAVNFYEPGVTEAEVKAFYAGMKDRDDPTPISYGLNSKVVREGGTLAERPWKVGGMYSEAIEQVVFWLEKATTVAENEVQRRAFQLLIAYYQSGDLKVFDDYSIAWVQDTASKIDLINGFIEVYNDPLGYKGSYESVVQIRDPLASKRIAAIGAEAQYFEDVSPIMNEHKKANVKGISARVINVAAEAGDASPTTPIGINLPNANWIRAEHGSKSVNLANIVYAYEEASKTSGGVLEAFAFSDAEIERSKAHSSLADALHTDMHEVIGHASGKLEPGVGTPKETLSNYASTIEEGRADLVALYYMLDPKLVEMGLMPSLEVGKAAYDDFIRNGLLLQLRRIEPGAEIEEDHMRNRAFISRWVLEKGSAENVIERKTRDGHTFFVINDYEKLQGLFGELLQEVQRIKSQGDFEAAKALVEGYGVKVDPELHQEVLDRMAKLNLAPYSGFINPVIKAEEKDGKIVEVTVDYPDDFTEQMLYYGATYSFLPVNN